MQTLSTQSDINLVADISVGQLSSPSSSTWNSLVTDILLPGIYKGGQVKPDSGLRAVIAPFVARTLDKTIRVKGDAWISITFPSYGEYFVVADIDQDSRLKDMLIMKAIPTSAYDEKSMVIFAKVIIPRQATQLTEAMIDTASFTVRRSLDPDQLLGKIKSGRGQFKVDPVINHDLGHQKYTLFIQAETDDGSVGNINYTKENSKSVVSNTGTSTGYFSWMLLIDTTAVIAEGAVYGQTLVTPAESELRHNLNNANYFPVITPMEEVTGRYWVTKDKNFFTVQTEEGKSFRAMWAAMPINKNLITGVASFSDKEIIHGIGNTDYRFFWVSLNPNVPSDVPKFTYEGNRVVVDSASTGIFQYVIVKDNLALNGKLSAGTSLDHQLNRDDYIVLASNRDSLPFAMSLTHNSIFLTEGTNVDVSIIPASTSWALGDWTRPAPSPRTHRIEFAGFATSSNTKGSTVLYQLCTQQNIIRKSVAQVLPATPLGEPLTLQFYVNDILKSTMTIAGDGTGASQIMAPIGVNIGDIIKVVLVSNPPKAAVAFSWYGSGEVQADTDLEMELPENAPAFSIIRQRVVTYPGMTGDVTVPEYIVGANTLSMSLNGKEIYLDSGYKEKDSKTITLLNTVIASGDYLEATVFKGEHPQSSAYLNGRPLTAEEAAFLQWAKGQITDIRNWIAAGCPGIKIDKSVITAMGTLENDLKGNVEGNVSGTAGMLLNLDLTGEELQTIMDQLTSKEDTDLHYHKSDRNRENHTGKQKLETISDAGTAASKDYTETLEAGKVVMVNKDGKVAGLVHDDDLGTAAAKDVGTAAGNVPIIDEKGFLPVSIIPARSTDNYEVGYEKGQLPYLDDEALLPKAILPVKDIAYLETGVNAGNVPVYDEKGKLAGTVSASDLGSAAKKDAGTGKDMVLLLDADGKFSSDLITGLGTAAKTDTGTKKGNVPILNDNGKIDSSLLDIDYLSGEIQVKTGTNPGEIPVYDEDGRLYNTLIKGDLGTAAEKDVGTAAGNVLVLDANGKIPASTINGLGSAATKDVGAANGVAGLDSEGLFPYDQLSGAPTALDITFGSDVGDVPKYDENKKLANTVAPKDLGTAAKANTGAESGNVPVINENGKIEKAILPLDEKSAAYYLVGNDKGMIPALDDTGKLPVSVFPENLIPDFTIGNNAGNIVAVGEDGKINEGILPDFKKGAFSDVGKVPNGLIAFTETGDYPEDLMLKSELGTAALVDTGDEEGLIPLLSVDGLLDLGSLVAADQATDLNTFTAEFLDNINGLGAIAALRGVDARRYIQKANVVALASNAGAIIPGCLNFINNGSVAATLTLNIDAARTYLSGETITLVFSKASQLPTYPVTLGTGFAKFMGAANTLQFDEANLSGEIKLIYVSDAYGWHVVYPNLA